jgi:hypothetical protein
MAFGQYDDDFLAKACANQGISCESDRASRITALGLKQFHTIQGEIVDKE